MKSYANKLFIVLYFAVRSSRSSVHGRHFVIGSKHTVGEGVGVFIVVAHWSLYLFVMYPGKVKHEHEIMKT